ncbi:MAG: hypothetical protein IJI36_11105 [Kiritimatiellae bacterium]|nr:hypothetical protein [Kiritimatiellia bacterium]
MTDGVRIVDPYEIMRKSLRFDLIFKVELACAWANDDVVAIRRAEEAYLEMVRARNGFYERMPAKRTPGDFIDGFRTVAFSIRQYGYDPHAEPVPIDVDGEVVNGAHRLSACIAYGKRCPVIVSERLSTGGSRRAAFWKGKIAAEVENWGMRAYLRRFPDGRLADEFATEIVPDSPFPDWALRARKLWLDSWLWRLREKAYLLRASTRTGERRMKALRKADECRQRAEAPFALAQYWKERMQVVERD